MSENAADMSIVQEILEAQRGSSWRWTNQHPKVKVWVNQVDGWSLHVKFTLPGVVLRATGPVTIRFSINDHLLGTRTFDHEQEYGYVKAVPSAILRPGDPNVIALDLDRVYVSPKDGVKLGILLQEIGVKRAGDS